MYIKSRGGTRTIGHWHFDLDLTRQFPRFFSVLLTLGRSRTCRTILDMAKNDNRNS
jgi:hypothetical protein